MSKYDPVGEYLGRLPAETGRLTLTFADLERMLGFGLPKSAYAYRPWWANDRSHVHAVAWLDAGWETSSVDIPGRRVTFCRREGGREGVTTPGNANTAWGPQISGSPPREETPEALQGWQQFEEAARQHFSRVFGMTLAEHSQDIGGKRKKFDLVNLEHRIAGDCKRYGYTKSGARPSGKIATLNETVWLLQRLGSNWRKFLAIGEDERLVRQYVREFDALLEDVEIYYFKPGEGHKLVRAAPTRGQS